MVTIFSEYKVIIINYKLSNHKIKNIQVLKKEVALE